MAKLADIFARHEPQFAEEERPTLAGAIARVTAPPPPPTPEEELQAKQQAEEQQLAQQEPPPPTPEEQDAIRDARFWEGLKKADPARHDALKARMEYERTAVALRQQHQVQREQLAAQQAITPESLAAEKFATAQQEAEERLVRIGRGRSARKRFDKIVKEAGIKKAKATRIEEAAQDLFRRPKAPPLKHMSPGLRATMEASAREDLLDETAGFVGTLSPAERKAFDEAVIFAGKNVGEKAEGLAALLQDLHEGVTRGRRTLKGLGEFAVGALKETAADVGGVPRQPGGAEGTAFNTISSELDVDRALSTYDPTGVVGDAARIVVEALPAAAGGGVAYWTARTAIPMAVDLKKAGVDDKTAVIAAMVGGVVVGSLEQFGLERYLGQVGRQIVKKHVRSVATELGKRGLREVMVQTGTEGMQGFAEGLTEALAKRAAGIKDPKARSAFMSALDEAGDQFAASIGPMTLLVGASLPGKARGVEAQRRATPTREVLVRRPSATAREGALRAKEVLTEKPGEDIKMVRAEHAPEVPTLEERHAGRRQQEAQKFMSVLEKARKVVAGAKPVAVGVESKKIVDAARRMVENADAQGLSVEEAAAEVKNMLDAEVQTKKLNDSIRQDLTNLVHTADIRKNPRLAKAIRIISGETFRQVEEAQVEKERLRLERREKLEEGRKAQLRLKEKKEGLLRIAVKRTIPAATRRAAAAKAERTPTAVIEERTDLDEEQKSAARELGLPGLPKEARTSQEVAEAELDKLKQPVIPGLKKKKGEKKAPPFIKPGELQAIREGKKVAPTPKVAMTPSQEKASTQKSQDFAASLVESITKPVAVGEAVKKGKGVVELHSGMPVSAESVEFLAKMLKRGGIKGRRDVEGKLAGLIGAMDGALGGRGARAAAAVRAGGRAVERAALERIGGAETPEARLRKAPGGLVALGLRRDVDSSLSRLMQNAVDVLVKGIDVMPSDEKSQRQIYDAIEGVDVMPANASKELRQLFDNGQKAIIKLGEELVRQGKMRQESLDAYKGHFLSHIHLRTLGEKIRKGIRRTFQRNSTAVSEAELKHFRKRKYATAREAEEKGKKIVRDPLSSMGMALVEEGSAVTKGIFHEALTTNPETAGLMSQATVKVGKKKQKYIVGEDALDNGYRLLRGPKNMSSRRAIWGPLADKYVHPALADVVEGVQFSSDIASPISNALKSFANFMRRRVTVWNLGAQINQYFYNALSLDMAGVPVLQNADYLAQHAVHFANNTGRMKEYREKSSLMNADLFGQASRNVLPALRNVKTAQDLYEALMKANTPAGTSTAATRVGQALERHWRNNDQFFQSALWVAFRDQGMSVAESDAAVSELYPLPADVPPAIRRIDEDILGVPFLRMQYQSAKIVAKHLTTPKGWLKVMKWKAIQMAANKILLGLADVGPDEWDRRRRAMYGSPMSFGAGTKQDLWLWDMANKVPGQAMLAPLNALLSGAKGEVWDEVVDSVPRLLSSPSLALGMVFATGVDPFTKTQYWDKYTPFSNKAAAFTGKLSQELSGPTIGRAAKFFGQKALGDKYTKRRGAGEQALRLTLGPRKTLGLRKSRGLLKRREKREKRRGIPLLESAFGVRRRRR